MDTSLPTIPPERDADPVEHARLLRRATSLTIGVGAAHAALFLFSFWLLSSVPGPTASDTQITTFYQGDDSRHLALVGLYLMPFAGIAFIWFIVALRMWVTGYIRRENVLLSNVQLVSGILYIALFFVMAATTSTEAAGVEFSQSAISPTAARELPLFGSTLGLVFAMRMAAMFVITTSTIARNARLLPGWFTALGYLVGLFLLLSATLNRLFVLVFPLWLLLLCGVLLLHVRTIPADALLASRSERPTEDR